MLALSIEHSKGQHHINHTTLSFLNLIDERIYIKAMETVAMINPALVAKKQALEAVLRQKTEELRQLCLKEAVSIFIELNCTDVK